MELIYGDRFVIDPRGEVDVKGTAYQTYVVTGYMSDQGGRQ
jgi:hypothetical protein